MTEKINLITDDTITEDEYRTFTTLLARVEKIAEQALPDYERATRGSATNWNRHTLDRIEFKPLDRTGRDERYDIEFHYHDWENDHWSAYAPASLLWDPQGTIDREVERLAAEKAEGERLEAERLASARAEAEKAEGARARKWARDHGFRLVKDGE